MIPVIPTHTGQKAMDEQGLTINDVVELLRNAEQVQPVRDHPERRAFFSGDYELWLVPGDRHGEACWLMLGLRHWVRPVVGKDHRPVVGVEPKRGQRRSHGGAGNMLPTDFTELMRRVEETPGWRCERGGKHIKIVGPNGNAVTIPATASDYRAVRNAAAQLRNAGLDLRRTG